MRLQRERNRDYTQMLLKYLLLMNAISKVLQNVIKIKY